MDFRASFFSRLWWEATFSSFESGFFYRAAHSRRMVNMAVYNSHLSSSWLEGSQNHTHNKVKVTTQIKIQEILRILKLKINLFFQNRNLRKVPKLTSDNSASLKGSQNHSSVFNNLLDCEILWKHLYLWIWFITGNRHIIVRGRDALSTVWEEFK